MKRLFSSVTWMCIQHWMWAKEHEKNSWRKRRREGRRRKNARVKHVESNLDSHYSFYIFFCVTHSPPKHRRHPRRSLWHEIKLSPILTISERGSGRAGKPRKMKRKERRGESPCRFLWFSSLINRRWLCEWWLLSQSAKRQNEFREIHNETMFSYCAWSLL